MRLLLIRHGQTTSNLGHSLDTAAPGADLTDLGRVQAAAIPGQLANERIDALYVSNLVRSQQTAQPLVDARGLAMEVRPGIREISAGELEMRSDEAAIGQFVEVVFGWAEDLGARLPGGECGAEALARFDEVVAEAVAAEHQAAVFISHGAIIRVWVGTRADNVDMEYVAHHWLPNTAMITVDSTADGGWTVTHWSEHPLGGAELGDLAHTGPGGEPEELHQG